MYQFSIHCIGSLKEAYWRDAEAEYFKRLAPYAKFSVKEYSETRFDDPRDKQRVVAEEGERLSKGLSQDAFTIALDVKGAALNSEQFATLLQEHGEVGRPIQFVIGGPLGIDNAVLDSADRTISLSPLTVTHQLARIVLAEQLYRAMTIVHGKPYHY